MPRNRNQNPEAPAADSPPSLKRELEESSNLAIKIWRTTAWLATEAAKRPSIVLLGIALGGTGWGIGCVLDRLLSVPFFYAALLTFLGVVWGVIIARGWRRIEIERFWENLLAATKGYKAVNRQFSSKDAELRKKVAEIYKEALEELAMDGHEIGTPVADGGANIGVPALTWNSSASTDFLQESQEAVSKPVQVVVVGDKRRP